MFYNFVLPWSVLNISGRPYFSIASFNVSMQMANHIAKKNSYLKGVCNLVSMDYCSIESLYQSEVVPLV